MSFLASNGQHVPSMHKHWRLCCLHTHDMGNVHVLVCTVCFYEHQVATTFYSTSQKPQKKQKKYMLLDN